MTTSLRMRVVEAATRAIFEAEWDTVTWEEAKKGYRDNDAWDQFKEDHAFYYQAGEDAVTLILDCLAENADEWADYPAEADPIVVAHREIIARKLVNALREDR